MLHIFQLKNNYLFQINNQEEITSVNNIIWIDVKKSDDYEYNNYIKNMLNQYKINFFELENIKKNDRFFKNENGCYIRSLFFAYNEKNQMDNSIVFFIISNNCLYTLCDKKIPVFFMCQKALSRCALVDGNAYELLLNLFSVKLDDLTNKIENIYTTVETLGFIDSQCIDEYEGILSNLEALENMGWKIRINLLDTERAIKFLVRKSDLPVTQKIHANEILNDITSLLPYNEGIFQKINFLTQSIMGCISIEQNRIIKIFSVVFLPPTLIASSYGMNFKFMPELQWSFGYPIAIILMIIAGLAPYLYFKYKNWL